MTKHIYELTNEEIDAFIRDLLPVKKIEKDKYGEVFTHPDLINRLLDLLPNTVWSNPHLKWLDPSVGAGFFMIFVYQRLMHGLTSWEPNPKKKSTHIIKNMLYMVELNKTNCNLCTGLFGHQANLVCSDFLSDFHFPGTHEKKDEPFLFDCIVGNPPFQEKQTL
jgi:type I restriction-modification system DNA methylase subunit